MIALTYGESGLRVEGHTSTDPRPCHAISLILFTLHAEYGAPLFVMREAPEPSVFSWPDPYPGCEGLLFALRAFRLLARHYPSDVCFEADPGVL